MFCILLNYCSVVLFFCFVLFFLPFLFSVFLCSAVLRSVVNCSNIICSVLFCSVVLLLCCSVFCCSSVFCSVFCGLMLCCSFFSLFFYLCTLVLCSVVLYSVVLCSVTLWYVVLWEGCGTDCVNVSPGVIISLSLNQSALDRVRPSIGMNNSLYYSFFIVVVYLALTNQSNHLLKYLFVFRFSVCVVIVISSKSIKPFVWITLSIEVFCL